MSGRGVVWWQPDRVRNGPVTEGVDAAARSFRNSQARLLRRAAAEVRLAVRAAVRDATRGR